MKFAKGGLIIENNNPVCDNLYLKQGWVPVKEDSNPLTAEPVPVVDESKNKINSEVVEKPNPEQSPKDVAVKVEKPTVKAEPSKPTASKSTSPKRTYQKHK